MISPKEIPTEAGQILVKLMDDSWIINRCAGGHPFKPRPGVVWKPTEHCTRIPVPGDQLPGFMSAMRSRYGTCAVIAWHGERVLGHLVFLPRAVARQWRAMGWEHFGSTAEDGGTVVVINLAFCSLSGHEFRHRGVGKAMVNLMLEWATENGWQRVEVYDTAPGLFPGEWLDACIPPRPFWERCGFQVFATRCDKPLTERVLQEILADDPRHSSEEQRQKAEVAAAIRSGTISAEIGGNRHDLRRVIR